MWKRSFVAVSVLVGASLEEALVALPESASVGSLEAELRDPRKSIRATSLAAVAQEVTTAIAEVTLK